jgi:hypothetical protein
MAMLNNQMVFVTSSWTIQAAVADLCQRVNNLRRDRWHPQKTGQLRKIKWLSHIQKLHCIGRSAVASKTDEFTFFLSKFQQISDDIFQEQLTEAITDWSQRSFESKNVQNLWLKKIALLRFCKSAVSLPNEPTCFDGSHILQDSRHILLQNFGIKKIETTRCKL